MGNSKAKHRHWILNILLLNVIFRIVWLIVVKPPQKADFLWYYQHAKMLASGDGYHWMGHATAYWPIGWPFFLSLIFRITGSTVAIGLVVNVLLSTCIVYFIYRLCLLLFQRQDIAIGAAIAYSVLPSQIEWNDVLGSEELFTALLLIALCLYIYQASYVQNQHIKWIALSGICLGFAADVRPIPLLFPVFVLFYELWIHRQTFWNSFRNALTLGVCMFLAIAPVTIRNIVAMHHFVLVSTNGGVNLWQGTHTNGGYFWSWNKNVNPLLGIQNEIYKNNVAKQAAIYHIMHHIPGTIGNGFLKIYDLYKADVNSTWYTFHMIPALKAWTDPVDAFNTTVYFLLMVCFAIGLVWLFVHRFGHWKEAMLLITFVVYNTCFFFFFPAWDRFRYPLMPLFAVFAGIGIVVAWREMTGRSPSPQYK